MEAHHRSGYGSDGPVLRTQPPHAARNGLPPRKPYTGTHAADAERERQVEAHLTALRARLTARQRDTTAAFEPFTPAHEWYRERDGAPAPWDKPRCDDCGYLVTRCACPGGVR